MIKRHLAVLALVQGAPPKAGLARGLGFERALELAREWWRDESLSENTVATYAKCLRRLDREIGGLTDPGDALAARLARWRELQQRRLRAKEISASHVSGDRSALCAFYDGLVAERKAKANPARALPGVPMQPGRPRPIPVADQERMLRLPDVRTVDGLRDRAILECLRHGMRQGEVAGLRLGGVSYDEDSQAMFLEFRAKGRNRRRRTRDVPLEPSGAMIVARYVLARFGDLPATRRTRTKGDAYRRRVTAALAKLLKRARDKPVLDEHVFVTATERPLYQVWVNRMFNGYRDRAGVDAKYTVHTFRHRFCTSLHEGDTDLRDGMRASGHEDVRSYMKYTLVAKSKVVAAVGVIGRAITMEEG